MLFHTGLKIGQIINNQQLTDLFQVKNSGGMRFSKTTNSLVLVADYTKSLYPDHWIGDTLHFTGEGLTGDQDISCGVNARLATSNLSGAALHLFQVTYTGEYVYAGRVTLVNKPYKEIQPDKNGNNRNVWMFPVKPEFPQAVSKVDLLTFQDEQDYQTNGKQAIISFLRKRNNYKGCKINHIQHGEGIVLGFKDGVVTVRFTNNEVKTYNLTKSVAGGYLQFTA